MDYSKEQYFEKPRLVSYDAACSLEVILVASYMTPPGPLTVTLLVLVEWTQFSPFKTFGFHCDDPKLKFKNEGETISVNLLLFVSFVVPWLVFHIVEWALRRNDGTTSLRALWLRKGHIWYLRYLHGLCFTFLVVDVTKIIAGEPRPHFLDTCRPAEAANCTTGQYFAHFTCTNAELKLSKVFDSYKSFPSGHAAFSFYAASFLAVAGNYYPIYDAYYQQVDPNNKGSVGAMDAARFLKTSGLPDATLGKIWDLADSNGKGFLTKSGFFIALKLVALVQAGKEANSVNLSLDIPPPRMGDPNRATPVANTSPLIPAATPGSDWAMKPAEKLKYDQLFDSLNPTNGFIPGNKVKGLLMDSKLPVDTLGKIWDLADMDKDGSLDRHEFSIAMHLVYKALEKYAIPAVLPPELLPPGKRKDSVPMPGAIPVLPIVPNGVRSETPTAKLVSPPLMQPVTVAPLVPGVRTSSIQSSTPLMSPLVQPVTSTPLLSTTSPPLIPSLSASPLIPSVPAPPVPPATIPPIKPTNAFPPLIPAVSSAPVFPVDNLLSPEEPWVISSEEKVKYDALFEQADLDRDGFVSGHEIKDTFLKSGVAQPVLAHIWSLCDTAEQGKLNNEQFALALWLISRKLKGIDPPPQLTPDMIPPSCRKPAAEAPANEPIIFSSPEVDRLTKEIDDLVKEKLILETNITQREADIKIKTGEIRNLQTELDALVATLKQLENQKGEASKRINDLKTQSSELETNLSELKTELETEETEVGKLKQRAEEQETQLKSQEAELNRKKQELENMKSEETNLRKEREDLKTEIEIATKSTLESQEIIKEIKDKLTEFADFELQLKEAISHFNSVLESKCVTSLSEVFLHIEPKYESDTHRAFSQRLEKIINPPKKVDPFSDASNRTAEDSDFSKTDAFRSDPFANKDSFNADFSSAKLNSTGFAADPFASFQPSNNQKSDPFADNLAASKPSAQKEDDPFGCDPFAILHAPPKPGSNLPSPSVPRSESPSPALPPKKSKQPPPRPAPPRPAPPALPSGFDADFADFSSFNSKVSVVASSNSSASSTLRREPPFGKVETKADPFRDYRYEDPFATVDEVDVPRGASAPPLTDTKSAAFDPFFNVGGGDPFLAPSSRPQNGLPSSTLPLSKSKASKKTAPSEDQQRAWATTESVLSEKERRKRADQEKADYKLALKLSKAEGGGKKKSFRSKILL
ncbi:hypothetical protein V9T40_002722 [Parthenolecanium corni]|uniref:Calmodulin n=1 Tax=Parthenolecanium corni TaxID=536013 RepID=A0AAN9Y4H0_9HEMI